MLTAAGPEPHIDRFLDAAAATLCDHSMHADPRALLPRLDAKWVEPSLGLPVPLALGGQLGEAAPGLLLLSSSALDARAAIGLGQLLAAGEAVLCPGCLELCVSVGATLWTMVQEQGEYGWTASQLASWAAAVPAVAATPPQLPAFPVCNRITAARGPRCTLGPHCACHDLHAHQLRCPACLPACLLASSRLQTCPRAACAAAPLRCPSPSASSTASPTPSSATTTCWSAPARRRRRRWRRWWTASCWRMRQVGGRALLGAGGRGAGAQL